MADRAEAHDMGDSDDNSEDDAKSAVSQLSDLEQEEEDEVDYLVLELLHHLPADKSARLLKNLRSKEKAVQDLLHRNRELLSSCRKLDEENQALSDRVKEATEAAAQSSKKAAPPAPAANVDSSIFLQLERGKEEKILHLQKENAFLHQQVRRLDEACRSMDARLQESTKDLKKTQQQLSQARSAGAVAASSSPVGRHGLDPSLVEEEDRLYQESALRQAEITHKVAIEKLTKSATLNLGEDARQLERWSSDVAAMLMAVDGLEGQVKHSLKEPKAAKKAAKAAPQPVAPAAAPVRDFQVGAHQVLEASAAVLEQLDFARGQTEDFEKSQRNFEQILRGLIAGSEAAAAGVDVDTGIGRAEEQAESLVQQTDDFVRNTQFLSLEPAVSLLGRMATSCETVLNSAPPGLIPPHAANLLEETRRQIMGLAAELEGQVGAIRNIKAGGSGLTSLVNDIQASQRRARHQLRIRVMEELHRCASTFEAPIEELRQGLRKQSEAMSKARTKLCKAIEGLEATAKSSAVASAPELVKKAAKQEEPIDHSGGELLLAEIREVKGMAKALSSGIESALKASALRRDQLAQLLSSHSTDSASAPARSQHQSALTRQTTGGSVGGEDGLGDGQGKKKKNRRKSAAGSGGGPGTAAEEDAPPAPHPPPNQVAGAPTSGSVSEAGPVRAVDLKQELRETRDGREALEQRMKERMKALSENPDTAPGSTDPLEGEGEADAKGSAPRRKKKMYV